MTQYGYFDPTTGEYVITRPDTPTPWMNYIGQGGYGGIVSNCAGGYAFDRDPRNRRVTRYRYNSIPADQPGRYVYLRDQDTGCYWSPTWQPTTQVQLDAYECRHGPGYTRIGGTCQGIAAELFYFVPPAPATANLAPCEVWVLRVRNVSERPRRIRTFSYAELSFWNAEVDLHNLDWGMHIVETRYQDGVLRTSTRFRTTTTFFSSNRPPAGFDSIREAFIGRCRDLGHPIVVETGQPQNTQSPRGNNIASLCHDLSLAAGQEETLIYILGVTDSSDLVASTVQHFGDLAHVQAAQAHLQADWAHYLSRLTVETPDAEMNAMLNVWNQVQCRATLFWSRFVSAYETGLGRGMGTRDSAQDTLATAHNAPDRVRANLTMLWKLQFQDGHTWHQVFPLTGEGGPGLAAEFPDWPQWFSDDHLWLIQGTCAYLRETGDLAYLNESVSFYDGGADTIWNHILRGVRFTLEHRGPHSLPRMGFSDWNDTMNIDHGSGKAESVMAAEQFCRVMLDLAELSDHLNKIEDAQRFRMLKEELAAIINRVAWGGAWYARAFDDEGLPIGVQNEEQQKIALNVQTWAIIGQVATSERAAVAMESAHEKLNTRFGLALMWPPYEQGNDRVRGTTTYPPGAKENGGIFCHANTWAIVAAAQLGWSERAYQYYRQLVPLAREDADLYAAEPYVYCSNICGPTHPQFGYGRNAWLSGTASWMYVAATQWILGIRPTFKGLLVDPCIPPEWDGFGVVRYFRGVRYEIDVQNPDHVGQGVKAVVVDGEVIEDHVLPLSEDGQTHRVMVVMG